MGQIGRRPNPQCGVGEPVLEFPTVEDRPKLKHDNSRHRELCMIAAKWLRRPSMRRPYCSYVAVELVSATPEIPDVFGWNYSTTVLIEVKVSRSDFLADAKKSFLQNPEKGVGAFRYYCCPQGMIRPDEVPENWGLLWYDGRDVSVAKSADRQKTNAQAEIFLLASIMRREGIKPRIYDFRKQTEKQ